MKIGILTFHLAPSYGAFFQALALQRALDKLGHQTVVIDYMPTHRLDRFPSFVAALSTRRLGINRCNYQALKNLRRYEYISKQKKIFVEALSSHVNTTKRTWRSIDALIADPPDIDAVVLGSDQIWNTAKTGGQYDPAYFGQFGDPGMIRIAYAASFGKKLQGKSARLCSLLNGIDHISVRESSAQDIVYQNGYKNAPLVLDPTFLLQANDYPSSEDPLICNENQYVLGYILNECPFTRSLLHDAGRKLAMKTIDISSREQFPSPLEPCSVLNLVKNAAFVVTNSFHGLALSINFSRAFLCCGLQGRSESLNERHSSLLNLLELHRHYALPGQRFLADANLMPPNWETVHCRLDSMRNISEEFLMASLST